MHKQSRNWLRHGAAEVRAGLGVSLGSFLAGAEESVSMVTGSHR